MVTQNCFTFPFYIPRICRLLSNWPEYLFNYVLRKRRPAEYRLRNGFRLMDGTGTLPGTLAEVFVRRRYGLLEGFRTIVDVGANVGSFAVYAAQSCPDARIYCYEPEEQNFGLLKRNVQINGLDARVSTFQCAVASSHGRRELSVGSSPLNSFHVPSRGERRQMVDCTTLPLILADQYLDTVDLLKMNCEGAEYEVLEGCADADLDRIAAIRLEYHNLDHFRNGERLAEHLQLRGFTLERVTRRLNESGFIWAARPRRSRRHNASHSR